MTVSLGTQQDMREMDARGVPRAQISRELGVSRNTVARYVDMGDMSPAAPVSERRPWPATEAYRGWIDGVLEEDLGRPRKQRHTARRIYDRMVSDLGYPGSHSSVCRYVALWRREHAGSSPRDGYLELEWAPGTAQADFGNFRCMLAGEPRSMKPLVVTLPHSNARYCVAMLSERSECLCAGLRAVCELIGRAPALIVLDNATEAGRMVRGEVTESALFSLFRAHYRCASRCCNPYSGNERGSVENAVGFLRRSLLVPEPSVSSLGELNAQLRAGCDRVNASSRCRDGRPTPEALAEDLTTMLALPGVPFDAVRWVRARADKRVYVEACGNRCCAGPAWHGRELVARPRAFGESTVRRDMPPELVSAMDRCGQADGRRALRAMSRASEASGFGAACAAAARIFGSGRVPDDASCDLLARRIAGGEREEGGADLAVYDLVARGGEARRARRRRRRRPWSRPAGAAL